MLKKEGFLGKKVLPRIRMWFVQNFENRENSKSFQNSNCRVSKISSNIFNFSNAIKENKTKFEKCLLRPKKPRWDYGKILVMTLCSVTAKVGKTTFSRAIVSRHFVWSRACCRSDSFYVLSLKRQKYDILQEFNQQFISL